MQHNAYTVCTLYMLYVGLIQKYNNNLDLWLTKQSSQEELKTMLRTAKLWRENKEYHSIFEQGLLNYLKNNTLKFMKATPL